MRKFCKNNGAILDFYDDIATKVIKDVISQIEEKKLEKNKAKN